MAASKSKAVAHSSPADTTLAVDAFMATLEHPFKSGIERIRQAMLAADASVAEGIKWNAPSFRTSEYFSTTHLRAKQGVSLIFHLGAKVRDLPAGGVDIQAPHKLLTWLGKDRAMVAFGSAQELEDKQVALQALVRQWIRYV